MKRIATLLTALSLCVSMPVSASAQYTSTPQPDPDSLAYLFHTQLNVDPEASFLTNESFYSYVIGKTSDRDDRRVVAEYLGELPVYIDRTNDHIERSVRRQTSISSDQVLADFVDLRVEKGKTLTVRKDATLVVYGKLIVDGTLINRGTIIIGSPAATKEYEEAREISSTIVNNGKLDNRGTIEIARGGIENRGKATASNAGTISIRNSASGLVGIQNRALQKLRERDCPTFANTGTIEVRNRGGVGIKNEEGCVFRNSGRIQTAPNATIRGDITGSRPVALDQ